MKQGEKANGDVIAVKKLTTTTSEMDDKLFLNEVQHVMAVCHPNIVRLEGYCCHRETEITLHEGRNKLVDQEYRLLCFEYLPKGSLDNYLSGRMILSSKKIIFHTTTWLTLPLFSR
jgi:coatomer subunit beta'